MPKDGAPETIATRLRGRSELLRARSVERIAEVLGGVGERFLTSGDPLRRAALQGLPAEAELSRRMAEAVLDGMARDWLPDRLSELLESEFTDPSCLDEWTLEGGRYVTAFGGELTVQVVAGSVPGVSVNALVRSLLVKSPTLLKPGAGDRLLPALFHRGIAEADEELATCCAVTYWPGSDLRAMQGAVGRADVVVVYGGDSTVRAVRDAASPTARVIGYHHREAIVVIGAGALSDESHAAALARDTARAAAMFEQRGCVCPHRVYVEEGGEVSPSDWTAMLADAMAALDVELPPAPLSLRQAPHVHQLRGVAEMREATGDGWVRHGGAESPWTVIFEPAAREVPSTLRRAVRVHTFAKWGELMEVLSPLGPHLQTIGMAGEGPDTATRARQLGRLGASRIVPVREMSFPPAAWLHDGQGPLRELVRWAELREL